ncbi:DUF6776 family protein [Thiohalorhabdus sp.]|uniref:DUF6776 family protein n=1 Tax=Thiohalorhabdus sp. TaxID=3094134 RepID=UPI002FC38AC2
MDRRHAFLVFLLHPNRGRPRTIYIRRGALYTVVVGIVIGVPAAFWGVFEIGHGWQKKSLAKLEREREQLAAEKVQLEARADKLRQRVSELKSSKSIRGGEVRKLRQLLADLQGRANKLQDEVGFYRNILDPDTANRDASVEDLQVQPLEGAGQDYAYSFKLAQGVAKQDPVRGYARVAVTFLNEKGEEKTLYFPEGARHRKRGMEADFRYFQNFDGRFELTPEAEPIRVAVQLYARSSLAELLSKEHAWGALLQAQGKEATDASQET